MLYTLEQTVSHFCLVCMWSLPEAENFTLFSWAHTGLWSLRQSTSLIAESDRESVPADPIQLCRLALLRKANSKTFSSQAAIRRILFQRVCFCLCCNAIVIPCQILILSVLFNIFAEWNSSAWCSLGGNRGLFIHFEWACYEQLGWIRFNKRSSGLLYSFPHASLEKHRP